VVYADELPYIKFDKIGVVLTLSKIRHTSNKKCIEIPKCKQNSTIIGYVT